MGVDRSSLANTINARAKAVRVMAIDTAVVRKPDTRSSQMRMVREADFEALVAAVARTPA